ncbi:MAG: hypothetical protein KDA58_11115 [Planctomycetaceae bacterium]|nr:hypothetical protein [Planctomycetaceae bacterium]
MYRYLLLGLFCLSFTLGCGKSGPQLNSITGKVSLGGTPVEDGTIIFTPQEGDAVGLPIIGGQYEVPAERGLLAGKYRVQIHWAKPTGKTKVDPDNGDEVPVTEEGMPAEYNENSTLEAEIQSGRNVVDFDL